MTTERQRFVPLLKQAKKELEEFGKERTQRRNKFIQDTVIGISSANSVEAKVQIYEASLLQLSEGDY